MKRRVLLAATAGAALLSCSARAQPKAIPLIGFLNFNSKAGSSSQIEGLARGLGETGYVEGSNLAVEYRFADSQRDRLAALAGELVERKVGAIAASTLLAAQSAKSATSTIPIIFGTANDPVRYGLVDSFNRPGGNLTGVVSLTTELSAKRLELLHELVPAASTITVLVNPNERDAAANIERLENSARRLGLGCAILRASSEREVAEAFEKIVRLPSGALLVQNDPFLFSQRDRIVALATSHAVPVMYSTEIEVKAGGLIGYDASLLDTYRQVGVYVGRILKGAKPADLPILQPINYYLVVNLKTAKALGLTIPPSILARADEVIE